MVEKNALNSGCKTLNLQYVYVHKLSITNSIDELADLERPSKFA